MPEPLPGRQAAPHASNDSRTRHRRTRACAAHGVSAASQASLGPLQQRSADLTPTPVQVDILGSVCSDVGIFDDRVERVLSRFRTGADLGLTGPIQARFCTNNRSATANAAAVSTAIQSEVAAGVTRGPFAAPPFKNFHVNPLSARVKENGAARLILDMSAPQGHSINELIDPADCSVEYSNLDQLALFIFENGGQGTQLFKADIKAAFKLIPVRPEQFAALGFHWAGSFWYQTALPYGCRASPKIFNEFATLLRDVTRRLASNPAVLNYLDDFFGVEIPFPGHVSTYQCTMGRMTSKMPT